MDAVLSHIQKAFMTIQVQVKIRKDCLKECHHLWESLGNLIEQYHCCKRTMEGQKTLGIFAVFPNLCERLQFKLMYSMGILVEKLQSQIKLMEKTVKVIHKQWQSTCDLMHTAVAALPMESVVTGTPTRPGIHQMLAWMQNINSLVIQDYHERLWMLESADVEKEDLMVYYHQRWKKQVKDVDDEVNAVFAYLAFFLEGD